MFIIKSNRLLKIETMILDINLIKWCYPQFWIMDVWPKMMVIIDWVLTYLLWLYLKWFWRPPLLLINLCRITSVHLKFICHIRKAKNIKLNSYTSIIELTYLLLMQYLRKNLIKIYNTCTNFKFPEKYKSSKNDKIKLY